MVTNKQPVSQRFSPNAKPYSSPYPSSNCDGLSDSASSGCTPKMFFGSSPALSTPGCNAAAKPFIPASQRLVLDDSAHTSFSLNELLSLQKASSEVSLGPEVPPEILASSTSNWVAAACEVLSSSSAPVSSVSDVPIKPVTLMGFIKSKSVLTEQAG
eukprot:TRINITY_DN28667_c0_g1_i1.p1 TRINITY_DN28667_c0_g1~~TRINITY_DN28667_c0_g1_i1.p1  ORF type:complete len:157 (+),score=30.61 TRINITY_DN28667_c0_g1_i1:48-518(+)